jgi:superfamily II DNA/RNA helicase
MIVFDEADRLFDDFFSDQALYFLVVVPDTCQRVALSATFRPHIKDLIFENM